MKKSILTILILLLFVGTSDAAQLNYQIRASVDDSTASSTESIYGQSILYVPYTNTSRLAFWRWPVFIPKGATIFVRLSLAEIHGQRRRRQQLNDESATGCKRQLPGLFKSCNLQLACSGTFH